jgi:hypothetical protein
MASVDKTRA